MGLTLIIEATEEGFNIIDLSSGDCTNCFGDIDEALQWIEKEMKCLQEMV